MITAGGSELINTSQKYKLMGGIGENREFFYSQSNFNSLED
jgi:hypothetical protein